MKPESADYLANARATLADAQQIAALPLPHIAAREAYLAAFHAAEAYIFEHTGNTPKSHRGVLGEFGRLSKAEPASGVTSLDFSAPLISSSNGRIMALVPLPSLLLLRKPSQPLQPRSASSTPLRKCCPRLEIFVWSKRTTLTLEPPGCIELGEFCNATTQSYFVLRSRIFTDCVSGIKSEGGEDADESND